MRLNGVSANTTYRYRCYPDSNQILQIMKTIGCCRYYYNSIIEDSRYIHEETGVWIIPSYSEYKQMESEKFLTEVDSTALANVLLNYKRALDNHFKNPKKYGLPQYKKRKGVKGSYRSNVVSNNIRIEGNHLRLPKVGNLKLVMHRQLPEHVILKSVTVTRESNGNFYVSLHVYDSNLDKRVTNINDKKCNRKLVTCGLDYSSHDFFISNLGYKPEYLHIYLQLEKKLARYQRKLSRMPKGSSNYKKFLLRVNKIHNHIKHLRLDYHHKLSRWLANHYDVVCIEDLSLQGISSSGYHLGKATLDNAWGQFVTLLTYKMNRNGGLVIKVNRWFASSKTCCNCGYVNTGLRLRDRRWLCPSCNTVLNRDVNAANNILLEGLRMLCSNEIDGYSGFELSDFVTGYGLPVGVPVDKCYLSMPMEECKTINVLPVCKGFRNYRGSCEVGNEKINSISVSCTC